METIRIIQGENLPNPPGHVILPPRSLNPTPMPYNCAHCGRALHHIARAGRCRLAVERRRAVPPLPCPWGFFDVDNRPRQAPSPGLGLMTCTGRNLLLKGTHPCPRFPSHNQPCPGRAESPSSFPSHKSSLPTPPGGRTKHGHKIWRKIFSIISTTSEFQTPQR